MNRKPLDLPVLMLAGFVVAALLACQGKGTNSNQRPGATASDTRVAVPAPAAPAPAPAAPAAPAVEPVLTAGLDQPVKTEQFEIVVTGVEKRFLVGTPWPNHQSKPAEGSAFLAVRWKFKNLTSRPLPPAALPTIKLLDPNGTAYDLFLQGTVHYYEELQLTERIFSSLNPGVWQERGTVFEFSKQLFGLPGWKLAIATDRQLEIPIQSGY